MPAVEDGKTYFQRSNSESNSAISLEDSEEMQIWYSTLYLFPFEIAFFPLSEFNRTTVGKWLETQINQIEKKTQQNNNSKTSKQHKHINKNSDFWWISIYYLNLI